MNINMVWVFCLRFNATFSNISAISRRPVLLVEEAGHQRFHECNIMTYAFKGEQLVNAEKVKQP
jgi:hypothetical protein